MKMDWGQQTQGSIREPSMEDLSCQLLAALEYECHKQEKEIDERTAYLSQLKERCEKQTENNEKQSKELERLKVMIQVEVMNRDACLKKNDEQREKCEELQQYLQELCGIVNLMNGHKQELTCLHDVLAARKTSECDTLANLQQKQSSNISQVEQILLDVEQQREREQAEFQDAIQNVDHLVSQQQAEIKELMSEIQKKESDCKEKSIMINMLTPQNNELQQQITALQNELTSITESADIEKKQLHTMMEMELKKKKHFIECTESHQKELDELTNNTVKNETEIKSLDGMLKNLILQEEEIIKIHTCQEQETNELLSKAMSLKTTLKHLLNIDEENKSLQDTSNKLKDNIKDYNNKIQESEINEKYHIEQLEKLANGIKEMEVNKCRKVEEKRLLDDKVNQVLKKTETESTEFKKCSEETICHHQQLKDEYTLLGENILNIKSQILGVNEQNSICETKLKELNNCLISITAERNDSVSKMLTFLDSCDKTRLSMAERESNLDNMLLKAIQDQAVAQSDIKELDTVKDEAMLLQNHYERQCQYFEQELKSVQESLNVLVKEKEKEAEETRLEYDSILKKHEQTKINAMLELKESTLILNEMEQKKTNYEGLQCRLNKKMAKYDNLIKQLEAKLAKVQHLATTVPSQQTSQPANNQLQLSTNQSKVTSPSDSSAETYVFSEEHLIKPQLPFKRYHSMINKKSADKKKRTTSAKNKKANSTSDDWGFVL